MAAPEFPTVSVCIPTYNGAKHLRDCLETVQRQTLQSFEVILVDDASTDRTVQIAAEFARNDRRFEFFSNSTRLGLASNWNRVVELSRGEWIKFVFQDDLLHETCLDRLVSACTESRSTFGFCDRELLIEGDVSAGWLDALALQQRRLTSMYQHKHTFNAEEFIEACIADPDTNLVGEPTVTIFRRSAVAEIGLFEPRLIQLADTEYWMRLGANYGVLHLPESLATFRVHGSSTTSQNLASRRYRMLTLDPLLQHYLVLRKPYYRSFRKVLFRKKGLIAPWWRCMREAYLAKEVSLAMPSPRRATSALKMEWATVASAFPALNLFAIVYANLRRVWKCTSAPFLQLTRSIRLAALVSK